MVKFIRIPFMLTSHEDCEESEIIKEKIVRRPDKKYGATFVCYCDKYYYEELLLRVNTFELFRILQIK